MTMTPETYCPAHSELMRSLGAVEANQETLCKDVAEIKRLLKEKAREEKTEERARLEMNAKTKILLAVIGTVAVALISSGTHYLIVRICG
jgi:hypothetical protein